MTRCGRLIAVAFVWWAAHLVLALPLAAGLWRWLRIATDRFPEADPLAARVNIATIAELLRGEHGNILSLVAGGWAVTAGIALVVAPLVATGTLAVVLFPAPGILRTFATGIGRGGWRALTLGLAGRIIALGGGLALALAASRTVTLIAGEASETGAILSPVAGIAVGIPVWLCLLALGDLALVTALRAPAAPLLELAGRAFAFWVRHPLGLAAIWIVAGIVPTLALQVVYLGAASVIVTSPLLLLCVQQIVMFGRAFIRVQVLARECALVVRTNPQADRSFRLRSASADSPQPSAEAVSSGNSVSEVQKIGPRENREGEVHQGQEGEHAVQPEQVQAHRATHSEELREGQSRTDAGVGERVSNEGVPFREAEGDAEVRERTIEDLRDQKQDDDEVSKPGVARND